MGSCYLYRGQYHTAIQLHGKELSIAQEYNDRVGEVNACNNLGSCYMSLGQFERTIALLEKAGASALLVKDELFLCYTCNNLGNSIYSLGQYVAAIEMHEQVRAIVQQVGDPREEATSCRILVNCYSALKLFPKAITLHERAQTISLQVSDVVGEAKAYASLGDCYGKQGNYELAIQFHNKSMLIAKELGDRSTESVSYGNLDRCCYSLGRFTEASALHKQALTMAQELGDISGESKTWANLGASLYKDGDPVLAVRAFVRGLDLSQRLEHDMGAHDDRRISLFEGQQHTYQLLQGVLMELNQPMWAVGVCEQAKARALSHRLSAADVVEHGADRTYEDMCREWWREVQDMALTESTLTRIVKFSFLSDENLDDTLAIWVVSGSKMLRSCRMCISTLARSIGVEGCSVTQSLELLRVGMTTNNRGASQDLLEDAFEKVARSPLFRGMHADGVEELSSAMMTALSAAIAEQPHFTDVSKWCSEEVSKWLPAAIQEWKEVHIWLDVHGQHELEAVGWLKNQVQSWSSLRREVAGLKGNKSVFDEQALRDRLDAFLKKKRLIMAWVAAEMNLLQATQQVRQLAEAFETIKNTVHQWEDLVMPDEDSASDDRLKQLGVNNCVGRGLLREKIQ